MRTSENSLPGTGVKIVSAVALFHSFGVARQGPWVTWVNKGKGGEGLVSPIGTIPPLRLSHKPDVC